MKKKRAISNMMQLPGGVCNSQGEKNSFTNLCYAAFLTKGHKVLLPLMTDFFFASKCRTLETNLDDSLFYIHKYLAFCHDSFLIIKSMIFFI